MRRRKLTADGGLAALGWLRGLPLKLDQEAATLVFSRLAELAMAHQLSVYDAAHLELALRRQLPLACAGAAPEGGHARAGAQLWR